MHSADLFSWVLTCAGCELCVLTWAWPVQLGVACRVEKAVATTSLINGASQERGRPPCCVTPKVTQL